MVAVGVYDGHLRRACLRCKQPEGEVLASALAGLLFDRATATLMEAGIDLVVPVPRFWMHRISRPHNAAETLAHVLANRLGARFGRDMLRKVRRTPAQTELAPTERRKNLKGAFRTSNQKALAGKRVLLVDDILTTGATADEAARVLKRAGAKKVVVAVLARGLGGR